VAADDPTSEAEELRALVGQFRTHLEARGRSGLVGVSMTKTTRTTTATKAAAASEAPAAPKTVQEDQSLEEPAPAADKPRTGKAGLQVLRDEIGDCQRCKLAPTRTNLVYGVGNPDADLVFVGEAPGADEDAQGEPFVGKAGQLLTKMIEAMGYTRDDVYICNVLKCRPPANRNPEPDEVASCEPFLKRQLAAIRPRIIVALGKFAAQCLLRDDTPITRLRGGFRSYEGIPLMPTLHPAYLLRDPSKKKLAWDDLKAVNAALARVGIHPPRPQAG
jgi:uracil-DNA glycosylase family 4